MKKYSYLLTFLLCLLSVVVQAQSKSGLYIHSYKGDVMIKICGTSRWIRPSLQQTMARKDSIHMGEKSRVVLVDSQSGIAYVYTEPMHTNVMQYITLAKANTNGLLGALAKQLVNNVTGKGLNTTQQNIYGGTMRTVTEDVFNDSIACLVYELGNKVLRGETNQCNLPLELRTIEQDGFLHFVITNNSKQAYCVNVVEVNDVNRTISLRIIPSPDMDKSVLMLPAGEQFDLTMFCYKSDASVKYTLFATDEPFSPSAVQALLMYPKDLPCKKEK